ncbi:MAG: hypothetical protein ACI8W7_002858, partial [Gammaproteobacteria bacterium]
MTVRSSRASGEQSLAKELVESKLACNARADDRHLDDLQNGRGTTPATIAIVLKGYPRLSETFIAQEIRALEGAGLRLRLVSLRHPTDAHVHPIHSEIHAPVRYLPEYAHQEPARVARAWWCVRRLPGYRDAWRTFVRDLWRDRTMNR